MWEWYLGTVKEFPFASAAVQFAVLGTLGEMLSTRIRDGAWGAMLRPARVLLKAVGWALLGVYIKVMFKTAVAGVAALGLPVPDPAAQDLAGLLGSALATSALMNVMLGPSMMVLHRLADNAIDRALGAPPAGWKGLGKGMLTLLWLWIPLHTVSFSQVPDVRIGVAAFLSMVLGIVMGWTNRKPVAVPVLR